MGFKKWLENQVAGVGDDSLAVKMRRKRMDEFERFFYKSFKDKMDSGEKITFLTLEALIDTGILQGLSIKTLAVLRF